MLENYSKILHIEALTMMRYGHARSITPPCIAFYTNELGRHRQCQEAQQALYRRHGGRVC